MADIFNMADTWNNAGTTFKAIAMDVTDTASQSASLLLDLLVGGSSKFSVSKGGLATGDIFNATTGHRLASAVDGSWTSTGLAFKSTGTLKWGSTTNAASTPDVILARDAAGVLALRDGNNNQTMRFGAANAAYAQISTLNESHTLAAAGTSDTTIQFPANSIGLGVTVRVTTLITGCSTFDVGISGATTRYGTGLALSAGTTNASPGTTNPSIYASATAIRFTAVGGGASFTAGAIRVTLHYISLSAPTS